MARSTSPPARPHSRARPPRPARPAGPTTQPRRLAVAVAHWRAAHLPRYHRRPPDRRRRPHRPPHLHLRRQRRGPPPQRPPHPRPRLLRLRGDVPARHRRQHRNRRLGRRRQWRHRHAERRSPRLRRRHRQAQVDLGPDGGFPAHRRRQRLVRHRGPTPRAISSSSPPARTAPITTAANAPATTASPIRSSRSAPIPASSSGISRPSTTTCGTTTSPCRPFSSTSKRNGRTIPAVGVGPKSGNFFILNRTTGKPIFGVEERAVPKSDVAGETASPTQPFPIAPRPLAPQKLTAADAWGADDASRQWCRDAMSKLRAEGVFYAAQSGRVAPHSRQCRRNGVGRRRVRSQRALAPHPHEQSRPPKCNLIPRAEFDTQRAPAASSAANGNLPSSAAPRTG